MSGNIEMDRDRKRELLQQFYNNSQQTDPGNPFSETLNICDPYDINSPDFNSDLYLNKLLKEANIKELMDQESRFYKEIKCLDSEMQTLVYENYNKFINATETIRQMSSKFDKMEEELQQLSKNMDNITQGSEKISRNLCHRRQDLNKLSGTHEVLKKLQFLFELSPTMKSCIERKEYQKTVAFYLKAECALQRYSHFPSIKAIDEECDQILDNLKQILQQHFSQKEVDQLQLRESIELLLLLKESHGSLAQKYLSAYGKRLTGILSEMTYQVELKTRSSPESDIIPMDILEFVDLACNGFLSQINSIITSYDEIFIKRFVEQSFSDENEIMQFLTNFLDEFMEKIFNQIRTRIAVEKLNLSEISVFVRALDRFYRRMKVLNKVFPSYNFLGQGLSIVQEAADKQCVEILEILKLQFVDQITKTRHTMITSSCVTTEVDKLNLSEILITLETTLSEQVKLAITSLNAFLDHDITFCIRTQFVEDFCQGAREMVLVPFISFILNTSLEYQKNVNQAPSQLTLLLSRLCLDLEGSIISYLITFTEEKLNIKNSSNLVPISSLCKEAKECAQKLLNNYVRLEGKNISQMIKKSVETRDWMSSVEPRSVRSVMKRVVEDISVMDTFVGQLYEEGSRLERSSDSSRSRRAFSAFGLASKSYTKSTWSSYGSRALDNSLISNIQKLFSEKIEIFSSVEFSRLSVVTGIIKIGLKTYLECIRLCTFSRFGLQQVQVDAYYLQTHLWRFVSDENLVHSLLDEVMTSAVHRCVDVVMMEISVVEKICEGFI